MEKNVYNAALSEVLVFKTNISSNQDVEQIANVLASEKKIIRWNIDREDIDKVLRIECEQLLPIAIVRRLTDAGFECEELPD
jgi:tRNA G26 N,N-dimethylase Trm1